MKPSHPLFFAAAFGIASALTATAATVVDTFTGALSPAYTLTRVLDNGVAQANISFSTTGDALRATYTGATAAAEQVVLLRNDYSLAVGQTLTVDVSQAVSTSEMDIGIAVSSTVAPTVASVSDTDTRNTAHWAAVYLRPNQNAVRTLTQQLGGALVSNVGVLGTDETLVSKLWIKRNTATSFSLGYINTSAVSFESQTITMDSSVGAAIGIYADLRAIGGTLGTLDNLTIIPEPSAAALAGFAALGLAFRRRR